MTRLRTFTAAASASAIVFALSAAPALADLSGSTGLSDTATQAGFDPAASKELPTVIGGVIQGLFGLLGILLICIVLFAGFIWMTSQGDPEKIKRAKKMIGNAVIGLAMVISSYAIAGYVIDTIIASQQVERDATLHEGSTGADTGQRDPTEELYGTPCPANDPLCNVSN